MFRTVAAVVLLLTLSLTGSSQVRGRKWLSGTWEGKGFQTDTEAVWSMKLRARRGRYIIEYPSLKCGGNWRLIGSGSGKIRFREKITYGKEECVDNSVAVIQRLNATQIAVWYSFENSPAVVASAILNRRR
jgi:hypothetical protein